MVISQSRKNKILVIAAHPDDEILGCGGTAKELIKNGNEVCVLILGKGKTSRGEGKKEIKDLEKEMLKAHKIIGFKKTFTGEFPDNKFDSIPLLEIVKFIEKIKKQIKPSIIFTHYEGDLNVDHRVTYEAVITATRPMKGEAVKEIYSFEILSSTEWNFPVVFSPDTFFDISGSINDKMLAMSAYRSEIREFPHPRSSKGIETSAQNWGMKVGLEYAEAFKTVRIIK
jgi:LmbE family N-acetylglucosaminyl deacetylase